MSSVAKKVKEILAPASGLTNEEHDRLVSLVAGLEAEVRNAESVGYHRALMGTTKPLAESANTKIAALEGERDALLALLRKAGEEVHVCGFYKADDGLCTEPDCVECCVTRALASREPTGEPPASEPCPHCDDPLFHGYCKGCGAEFGPGVTESTASEPPADEPQVTLYDGHPSLPASEPCGTDEPAEEEPPPSGWLALYGWTPSATYCGGFMCPACRSSIEAGHTDWCGHPSWPDDCAEPASTEEGEA